MAFLHFHEELNELFPLVTAQTSVIHLNIRSLISTLLNFANWLILLPLFLISLIVPRLGSENLDDCVIPGYVLVTNNREFSCGGGVGLFINNEYDFQKKDNLRINAIENLWVETQLVKRCHAILTVYNSWLLNLSEVIILALTRDSFIDLSFR